MDKERYNNDPAYRERIKRNVRRYQKSTKGKANIKKTVAKRKKTCPRYLADYLRDRRTNAKAAGICTRCFKNPIMPNRSICLSCKDTETKRMEEYRKKHPEVMRAVHKRKRDRAKRQNICTQCFKRPPVAGRTKCQSCLDRLKKYATSHRL